MHRRPHDEHDGMKVWLAKAEVEQFLDAVEDTTHRIALGLAFRSGLRSAEVVQVTPVDVVDGPAETMLRVHNGKGGTYRETPIPPGLATTIRRVDDVRPEPSDVPLVDVSTRTVRRWVDRYATELAEETGDDGWRDLSGHDARRTWATLLAGAESVDPLLVCDWGGWSDLETFLEHYRGTYSLEVGRPATASGGSDAGPVSV